MTVVVIAFIWGNSLQDAPHSSVESRWILNLVQSVFWMIPGISHITMYEIRKATHVTEYMALGFFLSLVLSALNRHGRARDVVALGVLIACIDETLQLFSFGRSGQMTDVVIDTCGVILGVAVAYVFSRIGFYTARGIHPAPLARPLSRGLRDLEWLILAFILLCVKLQTLN